MYIYHSYYVFLELAMANQDWGLAFTLASYMDSKTFNYVRSKYFQTIPQNDILQTFFQLSNGRIPSCTTVSKFIILINFKYWYLYYINLIYNNIY